MKNDCKHYDKELDCCKWLSDWGQAMPVLHPCVESPCSHYQSDKSIKMASEKQIEFAELIHIITQKPLPESPTARDYFVYIRDNIEEYNREVRFRQKARTIIAENGRYRLSYVDEEQDSEWAAAMDFDWM